MATVLALDGLESDMTVKANITDDTVKADFVVGTIPGVPDDDTQTIVLEGTPGVDVVFAEVTVADTALSTLFDNNPIILNAAQNVYTAVKGYFDDLWTAHSGNNNDADHLNSLNTLDKSSVSSAITALQTSIATNANLEVEGSLKTIADAYAMTDNTNALITLNNGTTGLFTIGQTTVTIGMIPLISDIDTVKTSEDWASASPNMINLMNAVVDTKATGGEGPTDLSGMTVDAPIDNKEAFLSFIIPSVKVSFTINYDGVNANVVSHTVTAAEISAIQLNGTGNFTADEFNDGATYSASVGINNNTSFEGVSFVAGESGSNDGTRTVTITSSTISISDPSVTATLAPADVTVSGTLDGDVENAGSLTLTFNPVSASTVNASYFADVGNSIVDTTKRTNTFSFNLVDSTKLDNNASGKFRFDYALGYDPNSHRTDYNDRDE